MGDVYAEINTDTAVEQIKWLKDDLYWAGVPMIAALPAPAVAQRYYAWLAAFIMRVVVPFPAVMSRPGGCSRSCDMRGGTDSCEAPECYRS